ncbi:MAG: hypothetical protein Q9218_000996 [Villophora microphyllina]
MPRKSNASQAAATGEEGTPAKEKSDGVNIEDLSLPRTMVQRLAKGVLPSNTQIHKDAILAMSKGATVFISHIADKYDRIETSTSFYSAASPSLLEYAFAVSNHPLSQSNPDPKPYRANELTLSTSRKTISPKAVLDALRECEFADFLPRVEAELARFNEINTGKRNEYRRKIKEKETGAANDAVGGAKNKGDVDNGIADGGMPLDLEDDDGQHQDGERASKRMRRDEGFVDDAGGKEPAQANGSTVNGGRPTESQDELAMDEDDDLAEVEQQFEREEDAGQQDDEEEGEDEDESDEEEDDEDEADGSGSDTNARLRALQDGASSGVDEGSEDESD